jgi:uncharacterized protein (DUF2252 family)
MPVTEDVSASEEIGRALRKSIRRSSHAEWAPSAGRPDPVELIEAQNAERVPHLVPLRRGRMSASPFAFYRGSAAIMASDLAATPTSGLTVQLCGDAHLANFGVYASPERNLVFDVNDFDETLPGPFEWDVKRLATSFAIAARHRGFGTGTQRELAERAGRSYRTSIARFAVQGWIQNWYAHLDEEDLLGLVKERGSKTQLKRARRAAVKARSRDALRAATKLVEEVGGAYRFQSSPPVLVPVRDLPQARSMEQVDEVINETFQQYRSSLSEGIRTLVDRYVLVDVAMKVVGVGSVGTRCWVALYLGRDPSDVLLLQVKEATTSVLEAHLPHSKYHLHGRRVVEGQRLMQASSDIFLGWSKSVLGHHYYWRQLKDWKGSADLEAIEPAGLASYAEICGYTLARAHAVSGDPAAIAGYLGKGTVFDKAVGEFAMRYARQNEADHRAFLDAIGDGLAVEHEPDS